MSQHRESDPYARCGFKVFYSDSGATDPYALKENGWYWFPVAPPESYEFVGPFATEAEALADAREGAGS